MLLAGETGFGFGCDWLTELALVSSWPRADFRLSLFAHRTFTNSCRVGRSGERVYASASLKLVPGLHGVGGIFSDLVDLV